MMAFRFFELTQVICLRFSTQNAFSARIFKILNQNKK